MATELDSRDRTGRHCDEGTGTQSMGHQWNRIRVGRGLVGISAFLALWWVAGSTQPAYLLPTPPEVATAFWNELVSGAVFVHLGQSLRHYLPGVTAGVFAGGTVGIGMGWSTRLDDVLTPVTRVLRPIPPLAWIVFAIIWFGLGHLGSAFIVFIGAFWIMFYNAYSGVENASPELMETAATLGIASDWRLIRRVVLPEAMPELLTGLRTSVGQSWMMVIAAELFGAPGIGYEIITSANNLAMPRSVAYMFVISGVFLVSDWAVRRLERHLLAWQP